MTDADQDSRRAHRLLRWYPKSWRSRYGEEFAELLVADMAERPRSWRRTADVAQSALVARLTTAGLSGQGLEPVDQVRASLATLGCALAVFLAFGTAMWAQLGVGWQWARSNTVATSAGMVVMSVAVVVLAVLAAGPVVAHVVRGLARRSPGLWRPTLLALGGLAVLIVGSRHFSNGWPGTGGHPWAHQGLVPGGVAAFAWASTLSVTAYWAHPGALASFRAPEVAWMVLSPVAIVALVVGVAKIVRRLDLAPARLRFEVRVAQTAAVTMVVFLAGACSWVADGGPGPRDLFHAGAIDLVDLAIMALALTVAHRAVQGARRAGLVG